MSHVLDVVEDVDGAGVISKGVGITKVHRVTEEVVRSEVEELVSVEDIVFGGGAGIKTANSCRVQILETMLGSSFKNDLVRTYFNERATI